MMKQSHMIKAHVTYRFEVTPESVFDAWLDPELIGKWMFGPALQDEEIIHIVLDARPGGRFSFKVRRQGEEIDHVGEYLAMNRPQYLAFTWGIAGVDSSHVTVTVTALETGCEVTLVHELQPQWADYVERIKASWNKMLGELDKVLK